MIIRIAENNDIPTVSTVIATSWKIAYKGIVNDDYLDSLKNDSWVDFLTGSLDNENMFAMVLEEEQQIIGASILGKEDKNKVNLICFYLLPDCIGKGYGSYFYKGIEDEIKRRNYTKCILDVLDKNKRAIGFYEAHGFVDTNKIINATLGDAECSCKEYEKDIND